MSRDNPARCFSFVEDQNIDQVNRSTAFDGCDMCGRLMCLMRQYELGADKETPFRLRVNSRMWRETTNGTAGLRGLRYTTT